MCKFRFLPVLLFLLITARLVAQTVSPVHEASGEYSFSIGDVQVFIDPSHGARIVSYTLDGQEFMHTAQDPGPADMDGSTCWISPQNLWGWPPQPNVDLNSYTGGISGNKVVLLSAAASAGSVNFRIRKIFWANLADSSFTVQYNILNKSAAAKSFAAWEIMRVPTGGLTFFPINGSVTGDLAPNFSLSGGIAWWDYDSTSGIFQKAFADGKEGWLAHADNNRILHVKKFTDAASNFPLSGGNPLEKEIEFWADGDMYYNEIEKHSEYKSIPVNDSATLTMSWYLRKLPEGVPISEGSAGLLAEVQKILQSGASLAPLQKGKGQILLSPNPSAGWVKLSGLVPGSRVKMDLYNALGKIVLSIQPAENETVSLSALPRGIYFYSIESEQKRFTGRLVLNR